MSALIALILLAAAAWFVSTLARGPVARAGEPMDSVSDFSRAMRALDPAAPKPGPVVRQGGPPRRP